MKPRSYLIALAFALPVALALPIVASTLSVSAPAGAAQLADAQPAAAPLASPLGQVAPLASPLGQVAPVSNPLFAADTTPTQTNPVTTPALIAPISVATN